MGAGGRRWAGGGILGAVCLGCLIGLLWPVGASARETRVVADDRYELTVGFLVEPAYEGEPNGLSVRIVEIFPTTPDADETETTGGVESTPVELTPTPDPGSELTAEVIFGDQRLPLTLQPGGQNGVYRAPFVPTLPGDYVFRITGLLAGAEIDEEFRTNPEGIPPVVGVAGLQFPAEIPVGQGLVDALAEREDEAERARTLAVAGIALGVIGLLAGGLAFVLSRRPPPPAFVAASPETSTAPEAGPDEV